MKLVICGAGVIGSNLGRYLPEEGHEVNLIEQDEKAALRASEIQAEVLLKATKVDGVYSDDPEVNPKATRYDHLTYDDVVQQDLKIIDIAAISLCRENRILIIVFNLKREGNIRRVIAGEPIGTRIGD